MKLIVEGSSHSYWHSWQTIIVYMIICYSQLLSRFICRVGWRPYVGEELQRFVQKDNDDFSLEISEFDDKQKKILPAQHVRSLLHVAQCTVYR